MWRPRDHFLLCRGPGAGWDRPTPWRFFAFFAPSSTHWSRIPTLIQCPCTASLSSASEDEPKVRNPTEASETTSYFEWLSNGSHWPRLNQGIWRYWRFLQFLTTKTTKANRRWCDETILDELKKTWDIFYCFKRKKLHFVMLYASCTLIKLLYPNSDEKTKFPKYS